MKDTDPPIRLNKARESMPRLTALTELAIYTIRRLIRPIITLEVGFILLTFMRPNATFSIGQEDLMFYVTLLVFTAWFGEKTLAVALDRILPWIFGRRNAEQEEGDK